MIFRACRLIHHLSAHKGGRARIAGRFKEGLRFARLGDKTKPVPELPKGVTESDGLPDEKEDSIDDENA